MQSHHRTVSTLLGVVALVCPTILHAKTPAPDLVIAKTTQTSSTSWTIKVKNTGDGDAAPTTLKMVAAPGGAYSSPVAAIKAGGSADVPCRMPFKAREGMRCEFIVNPDKTIIESNYANNRTVSATNPKFN
ncbi:MAG TPA: CARDB domain-containing protein [Chthoniobacterales bacterium]|nr:CARDB domain-containing protein [Chthoniobacterales bacterium]